MYFKKLKTLFLLFLLTAPLATRAQQFNKVKLDSVIDAVFKNNKGMGSIALSYEGKLIYQRAYGYSRIINGKYVPAAVQTKYRIGSVSKMFTACMIFQLIDAGKLTLDTKLSSFYPQLPNAQKITIAMMLQHRSGLYNFTNDAAYATYMATPKTHDEMLAIFAKYQPVFEPDAVADYSNTNFVLLGYIVEKLTKQPYGEALKKIVLDKAALTETTYGGKISDNVANAASFYHNQKWELSGETDMSIPAGAGAVISTPADLNKFIEALFAGKIISKAHLAQMQLIKDNYGMAMFHYPFWGMDGYGHTGGIDNFGSQVIYFPAENLSIAAITNNAPGELQTVMMAALSDYFNKPFTIPSYQTLTIAAGEFKKYTGVYSSPAFPLKITVSVSDGKLIAQASGQGAFPLAAVKTDTFAFDAAGITLKFDTAKSQMTLAQRGANYILTKEE